MRPLAAPMLGAALLAGLAFLGWLRSPLPRSSAEGRLRLLEEVLRSRNDNDPRLETAFERLTQDEKRLLRAFYAKLPHERRNERGTIVYLLGRNLTSSDDWAFLREVVAEPPRLSLADCSRAAPRASGDEVTLAYPALVALRQARRAGDPSQAAEVLAAGRASPIAAVVRASR